MLTVFNEISSEVLSQPWATATVSSVLVFFLLARYEKYSKYLPRSAASSHHRWSAYSTVGPKSIFALVFNSIAFGSYAVKFMLDLCFTDKHTVKLIEIQLRLASWFRITWSHTHTRHRNRIDAAYGIQTANNLVKSIAKLFDQHSSVMNINYGKGESVIVRTLVKKREREKTDAKLQRRGQNAKRKD